VARPAGVSRHGPAGERGRSGVERAARVECAARIERAPRVEWIASASAGWWVCASASAGWWVWWVCASTPAGWWVWWVCASTPAGWRVGKLHASSAPTSGRLGRVHAVHAAFSPRGIPPASTPFPSGRRVSAGCAGSAGWRVRAAATASRRVSRLVPPRASPAPPAQLSGGAV
jgi:hypothetical protein